MDVDPEVLGYSCARAPQGEEEDNGSEEDLDHQRFFAAISRRVQRKWIVRSPFLGLDLASRLEDMASLLDGFLGLSCSQSIRTKRPRTWA